MKLNKIEAARGFAAAYVVAHHAFPHNFLFFGINAGAALRFGQEAVILFFLLSGFVIHYSYSRKPVEYNVFIKDRFLRIFVPLIPALLLSYIISSASEGQLISPDLLSFGANLLMLQDISSLKPGVITDPYMGNSALWSLSYEWWFYMIYILLFKFVSQFSRCSNIVITVSVIAALFYNFIPNWGIRIVFYLSIWWSGVVLCERYIKWGSKTFSLLEAARIMLPTAVVAIALSVGMLMSGSSERVTQLGTYPLLEIRHVVGGLLFVVLIVTWHNCGWRCFSYIFGGFAIIAPISYAIYILHYPFLQLSTLVEASKHPFLVGFPLFIAFIVSAACLELWAYPAVKNSLRETCTK
jgi:peptidoglycan/LPS O-acetylase OafA/YrhL